MPNPNELLCSVLMPTRTRPARLLAAIDSIKACASGASWEVLIRADDDDKLTAEIAPQLSAMPFVKLFTGSRNLGYTSVSDFYKELESHAQGIWCWGANDDMVVIGDDWDGKLSKVPQRGYIVQPEWSQLGGSGYHKAQGQAFPIVPRNIWRETEGNGFSWLDTPMHNLLVGKLGWKTWFLPGIRMWHQHDTDDQIAEHRK